MSDVGRRERTNVTIKDCSFCGGTHCGSRECPFLCRHCRPDIRQDAANRCKCHVVCDLGCREVCDGHFSDVMAQRTRDPEEMARRIWGRFCRNTDHRASEFKWLVDVISGNEVTKRSLTEVCKEAKSLEPPKIPIKFSE